MAWAGAGLGVVAGFLGWLLGPWVIEVAFGAGFVSSRLDAAVISVGVIFAGVGLFVGQILVARGDSGRLGLAWLGGLGAGIAAIAVTPAGPVTRVTIGFAAGALVAMLALVTGAVKAGVQEDKGDAATFVVTKRTIDIAVSLFILVLTTPIVLVAGLAVRISSPGPIFFKQTRVGRDARQFGLVKIRTMEADADESVFAEHLARLEASRHSETAPAIRISDDERVTSVGRFLRRWSIDELPNFWNVLRGSMSLVGPRPLVPAEAELVGLDSSRFKVKPGITGLAQIEGRDSITMKERTELDEAYVRDRSPGLDTRIMVRTIKAIFTEPGE
jgi:lipopolysaccharide/colanic/teichoic acid biosynthesis glycosyltransferase